MPTIALLGLLQVPAMDPWLMEHVAPDAYVLHGLVWALGAARFAHCSTPTETCHPWMMSCHTLGRSRVARGFP